MSIGIKGKKIKEILNHLHKLVLYEGLNNDYDSLIYMAKYCLQK